MAKKWSKCDFKELKKLEKRLEQLEQADWDKVCQDTAKEMAQMLLSKAKKLTPTGVKPDLSAFDGQADTVEATGKYGTTRSFKSGAGVAREYWKSYRGGSLKKAWTVIPIEKYGDCYEITVLNNLEYASYVEYGHRQLPGRYVPMLGKRLKVNWVPGKKMLTVSVQEVDAAKSELIEKAMYQVLKGVFDGDK